MPKTAKSESALDLRDLKMTTIGTLCKDMDDTKAEAMLTGVHGSYDTEAHLVIVARGERMTHALVEAFKRINEEMKAALPKWNSHTDGTLPGEAADTDQATAG